MEQQKNFDNSGSLFVNDRKTTDKHPDYKGSITIGGKKFWLSGWLRTNDKKDGSGKVQFISISAEEAEVRPVTGFPTAGGAVGGMLQTAASLSAGQAPAARQAAPRPAVAPAPAPAPAPAEEPTDDLPF